MSIKIRIDKEIFLSKLLRSIKFIPKKSIIPILDNFKLDINKNKLVITSSNGDITATINTECQSDETVSICLPARLLLETVKLFREPGLSIIILANHKVNLKCGKSTYKISGVDAANYKRIPFPTCPYEISLSSKEFKDGVEVTERFVDPKNNSVQLQGISITERNMEMIFVGCQTAALSKYIIKPKAIKDWKDVIVPVSVATAIKDMLNDKDVVDIYHDTKLLIAQASDMTIVSSIIDAAYPDTNPFFNTINPANVVLHVMEIKDALERLKLYTSAESGMVILTISGSKMEIQATDALNNHSGVEEVTLKEPASVDVSIGFSAEWFINILSSIENTEFVFSYSDNKKMAVINAVPFENEKINKTFLIMPMLF